MVVQGSEGGVQGSGVRAQEAGLEVLQASVTLNFAPTSECRLSPEP
jgi:hypothetical protein